MLVSRKPTGTLLLSDLTSGRRLFMLSTGTGAAPFMSLVKDPEAYERFDEVVLVHGVRVASESEVLRAQVEALRGHELLGEAVRAKLKYYACVTREPHPHRGRLTTLLRSGQLCTDLGIAALDARTDRAMVCGSPAMLTDTCALLDEAGFHASPHIGAPGDYVIERAFVAR